MEVPTAAPVNIRTVDDINADQARINALACYAADVILEPSPSS